ncbi:hypothetical protein [Streptomyces platensis]|uniref:hypothetical protein n=1 Tax=Streptomyces platensis TaxID=58346 RepID=UPI002E262F21
MTTELAPRLLMTMVGYGMPVDRFAGQLLAVYVDGEQSVVHRDAGCSKIRQGFPGTEETVGFSREVARRMCSRCFTYEFPARSRQLTHAVAVLITALDTLAEEDDEIDPEVLHPGLADLERWRDTQHCMSDALRCAAPYPWLSQWAEPLLARLAMHVERRRWDLQVFLNVEEIERRVSVPQDEVEVSREQLHKTWLDWRQRWTDEWSVTMPSPDHWSVGGAQEMLRSALSREAPSVEGSVPLTARLRLQVPPLEFAEWDCGFQIDPLTDWELAVIAAYQVDADWGSGHITLAVPRSIADEMLRPARNLDITELPLGRW